MVTVNCAAMNIGVCVSFWIIFSEYTFRSEIVASYGNSLFSFLHTVPYSSILFYIVTSPIYMSTSSIGGFLFLHTLSICNFLIKASLTGMRWHHIAVLICSSIIISDIEHLFMYLLAICISFEKCLFRSSAHFLILFYIKPYKVFVYFGN